MSERIIKQLQVILSNECPDLLKTGNDLKFFFLGSHDLSDGSRYNGTLPSEVAACIGIKQKAIWHALL